MNDKLAKNLRRAAKERFGANWREPYKFVKKALKRREAAKRQK